MGKYNFQLWIGIQVADGGSTRAPIRRGKGDFKKFGFILYIPVVHETCVFIRSGINVPGDDDVQVIVQIYIRHTGAVTITRVTAPATSKKLVCPFIVGGKVIGGVGIVGNGVVPNGIATQYDF